jgi:hypothetical protein
MDEVGDEFRSVLSRRQFVDRASGTLLVWVQAEPGELSALVSKVEARHPGARFGVDEVGSAVAVRITAREPQLAELEALYL